MKKIILLFILTLLALPINSFALILSNCPIDGKSVEGYIGGLYFITDKIDCDNSADPNSCSYSLKTYVQVSTNMYQHYDLPFYCSATELKFDTIRCFYQSSQLYCPAVDDSDMMTFYQGPVAYKYSKDVAVFRFTTK